MIDDELLRGAEGYKWEEASDLTSSSEEELRARLKDLSEEERAISYRRRVIQGKIDPIQGKIDPIRGEFVRSGVALSPEELAWVLLGRDPEDRRPWPAGEGG